MESCANYSLLKFPVTRFVGMSTCLVRWVATELPIVAGSNQASAIKLLLRKEAPQTIQPSEFVILFVKGISGLRYLLPFLVDAPGG